MTNDNSIGQMIGHWSSGIGHLSSSEPVDVSLRDAAVVVLKVGGSLFSLPDLSRRVEYVLQQRSDCRVLLVCGGGEAADIVRKWQSRFGLDDEAAHWLAFRAVTLNEGLLAQLVPRSVIVDDLEGAARAWSESRRPILCVERFVRRTEPECDQPLPHNWDVTSDSIAAWVAHRCEAEELLLAKSVDLPAGIALVAAAHQALVDRHFPRLVTNRSERTSGPSQTISWINLRCERPIVQPWLPSTQAGSVSGGTF